MVTTPNLSITHIETSQSGKEVTANAAFDTLDRSNNDTVDFSMAAGGSIALTAANYEENFWIRLTGAPAAATTLLLPDGKRIFGIVNKTGKQVTVDTTTGAATPVVLQDDESATIAALGTDLETVGLGGVRKGWIALDITSLREIGMDTANQVSNTASHGGLLAADTAPSLKRVNLATDKALRVEWPATNVAELQFSSVFMPPDLDSGVDPTVHLLAKMSAGTDTTTAIDVQVFDAIGDTEMGGNTADLTSSLVELTVTIANANVSGHPLGFLNIALVPEAHGTDAIELYAAWIEYTLKGA